MSTAETNPTPRKRKRSIVTIGICLLAVLTTVVVAGFVVEQVQDVNWHR